MGIASVSGILLYGPSGNGKSHLARALAARVGVNLVSIRASELFSKYVGESERIVRDLFGT